MEKAPLKHPFIDVFCTFFTDFKEKGHKKRALPGCDKTLLREHYMKMKK